MTTLTEQRQALRDQIWLAGPEHFDVKYLYDGMTGEEYDDCRVPENGGWTACFIGHAHLTGHVNICNIERLLAAGCGYINAELWHTLSVDGWNPGTAYDLHIANGLTDRHAQWHVAIEWLDRVIKGGE